MSTLIEAPVSEPISKTERLKRVFRRAAYLIEEFGWTRGSKGMPQNDRFEGSFCLEGAVAQAAYDLGVVTTVCRDYRVAQCLLPHTPCGEAFIWNDIYTRTPEEVLLVLRRLAEDPNTPVPWARKA